MTTRLNKKNLLTYKGKDMSRGRAWREPKANLDIKIVFREKKMELNQVCTKETKNKIKDI